MTTRDLTPFLHGLTPDPDAMTDARAFAFMLPDATRLSGRLEDLVMCFAHFAQDQAGPALQSAQTEARRVLSVAASGLYALLEDAQRPGQGDAWATLAHARLWAVDQCQRASAALSLEAVEALHMAFSNPHTLLAWATAQGRTVDAGRLAAWWAVLHLLEAAPHLEDGEADDLTCAMLDALQAGPQPHARAAHMPAVFDQVPAVHIAQYVEHVGAGLVCVSLGGGEDYTLTRTDCTLTPLPDGEGFLHVYPGTPDALTVRLEQDEVRTVCAALGFDLGEAGGPMSPLN